MAEEKKTAIKKAKHFCKRMKVEKKLRDAIADITARLNRSNLSGEEGKRHAKLLVKAYRHLENVEMALGEEKKKPEEGQPTTASPALPTN